MLYGIESVLTKKSGAFLRNVPCNVNIAIE